MRDPLRTQILLRRFQQIDDLPVDQLAHDGRLQLLGPNGAVLRTDALERAVPERHLGKIVRRDQADAQGVVDVVGVVGQAVGGIDDLGFQQRLADGEIVFHFRRVGALAVHRLGLEDLPRQVQAGEIGVAIFEHLDETQAVAVVLEAAVLAHALVEGGFAGVAERRMAQVVQEGDRLGQVLVEAELAGDGAADLGDFEGVRQAGAVVVAGLVDEHLGLVHEPAKRGGVDDAIAVALIEGAKRMRRLRMLAALAVRVRMA